MKSYSQDLEDVFLLRYFKKDYIGFYVDVGAYDPLRFSNTALFYKRGWRGINIEPNKSAIEKFNRLRPFDINLNYMIGSSEALKKLYIFNEKALNTTNKKRASFLNKTTPFKTESKISYKTVSLKNVFEQHLPPLHEIDFMSVDVETLEFDVLKSNDWAKFRPTYLLVEMLQDDLKEVVEDPLAKFLAKKAYTPFAKIGRTAFFKNLRSPKRGDLKPPFFHYLFRTPQVRNILNQSKAKIIILVPFYNQRKKVAKLAAQLKMQIFTEFETVFIDGGSTDGSAAEIRRILPAAIILSGKELWWAECLQLGYEYISAKQPNPESFVLILNEDTEFDKNFLSFGLNEINRLQVDLLGAISVAKDSGKVEDTGVCWDWNNNTCKNAASTNEINCLSTRGLLIRANVFLSLNGFRPALLPHYLSDYAYTIRAHRLGYKLATSPKFILTHKSEPEKYYAMAKLGMFKRLRILFSKKCKINPFYYFIFIWLALPNFRAKLYATRRHLRATWKMILGDPQFLK